MVPARHSKAGPVPPTQNSGTRSLDYQYHPALRATDTRFTCEGIGSSFWWRDVSEIRGDYGLSKPAPRLRHEPGDAVRRSRRREPPGGLRRGIVKAQGGRGRDRNGPCTPAQECAPVPRENTDPRSQEYGCGVRLYGPGANPSYDGETGSTTGSTPATSGAVTVMGSVLRSSGRTRVVSKGAVRLYGHCTLFHDYFLALGHHDGSGGVSGHVTLGGAVS